MRLAFVVFEWFPYGGMQRDLLKIVEACHAHSAPYIDIFCLHWRGPHPEHASVNEVHVRGLTKVSRRARFERFVQERVAGEYDVVLGFNRMAGLDYYFGADNSFTWRAMNQRSKWYRMAPRARHYMRQEAAVFGAESKAISLLLSPLQRAQYEATHGTPSNRLIDLSPGISRMHCASADAPQKRAAFRAAHGLSDKDLLVLQIGSSFNTKGVDRSLLALASLPESLKHRVHYLLLGQDKHERWLKQAQELGLRNVRIEAARSDITDCMQGADLLLHPSRHESAGMVILEAVVAGLPVLTTASCGYAFHVQHADAGQVCDEPFQQEQLNELLRTMLESERSLWRANGIAYGRDNNLYDMPQQVAALILGAARQESTHG